MTVWCSRGRSFGERIASRIGAGRARGGTKDAAGTQVVHGTRKFCDPYASTRYWQPSSRGRRLLHVGWRGVASAAIATLPADLLSPMVVVVSGAALEIRFLATVAAKT